MTTPKSNSAKRSPSAVARKPAPPRAAPAIEKTTPTTRQETPRQPVKTRVAKPAPARVAPAVKKVTTASRARALVGEGPAVPKKAEVKKEASPAKRREEKPLPKNPKQPAEKRLSGGAPKLMPATPELTVKVKNRRKRLSKAFPMPLEIERKKARKQELKRVLNALQALADEGMVSGRYSLPGGEHAQFMELRALLADNGFPAKKNQLIRAGLRILAQMPLPDLIAVLETVPDEPLEAANGNDD